MTHEEFFWFAQGLALGGMLACIGVMCGVACCIAWRKKIVR